MRCVVLIFLGFWICGIPVNAAYDYIIEEGYASINLNDNETLLMTGGGGYGISLFDNSQAFIQGTSPLGGFTGGIWDFTIAGYSQLAFSGGGIHEFTIGSYARATLGGGRVDEIWSYQQAWVLAGDPPAPVADPHITFVCNLESVFHDSQTNVLAGNWLDGTSFNIQLIDVDGYSPAIDNIRFIPEPLTLVLFGVGGVLVKRRR